ncbi:MAG: SDR family oxidoreductase [Bacteroidetes bacterium]|nr:SDR family oxidoreductase [Bacteroidota bacterium]
MILVTGSTGHFGKATIDFLVKKGYPVSQLNALVRDEAKAEDLKSQGVQIRVGDYSNPALLNTAFTGVDKLLLVSSSDLNNRTQHHINAIKAAKQAGVKHIVYTSFQRKNEVNSPIQMIAQAHLDAEKEILASGMTYTILQNGLYADGLPMFMGENVLETGIFLPAGTTKAALTVRADMAEAAANVLLEDGHENAIYLTATTEKNSYADVANILSEITGKSVTYTDAPLEAYKEVLKNAGVPEFFAGFLASFSEAIKQGEFDFSNGDLEKLLHHKPTTLKDFLKTVYKPS